MAPWCHNGKHARSLLGDSKLDMRSMLSRTSGSGPWLVMIYLLMIRKSPQIRTYGGVAFEATVMFEATRDVEGTRKYVRTRSNSFLATSRIEGGIFLVAGLSLVGRLSMNST